MPRFQLIPTPVLALLAAVPLLADPPAGAQWKPVFADDFQGTELDAAKWEKVGDGKRRGARRAGSG